jgi:hypothetical protein
MKGTSTAGQSPRLTSGGKAVSDKARDLSEIRIIQTTEAR